jgi:hypothetical protein
MQQWKAILSAFLIFIEDAPLPVSDPAPFPASFLDSSAMRFEAFIIGRTLEIQEF